MLGNIRDITTVIVVGLVMLVALLVFFMVTLNGSELSLDTYNQGQIYFSQCSANYKKSSEQYSSYTNSNIINMDITSLADMREELEQKNDCNSEYVVSSEEQISVYAQSVYSYMQNEYPNEKFSLLDTVYTAPSKYYAYTNQPQDYLFFAMSEDQSLLLAFVYQPQTNGYEISELWSLDEASDLDVVQTKSKNILVKYYEKII